MRKTYQDESLSRISWTFECFLVQVSLILNSHRARLNFTKQNDWMQNQKFEFKRTKKLLLLLQIGKKEGAFR